jgi:hypothetical protein
MAPSPMRQNNFLKNGGERSIVEIVKHAWNIGVNPGGSVKVQEVLAMPDEHKNKLITDDALLLSLGSTGRKTLISNSWML